MKKLHLHLVAATLLAGIGMAAVAQPQTAPAPMGDPGMQARPGPSQARSAWTASAPSGSPRARLISARASKKKPGTAGLFPHAQVRLTGAR